ncbi:MAG: GAF domain-containing sensor histidine kinase [Chloroflexi bacterium]|nr:GAF domain-containing sensor histidine kinase [Chloroflexota bacterium]
MRARRDEQTPSSHWVIYLRRAIPFLVAAIGIGYALFEHVWIQAQALSSPSFLRAFFVLGVGYPVVFWLILHWVTTIENSRLHAQARRHALHLETASLVGQRTTALFDLNALLTEVVMLIRFKFGYSHANLFLVDEDSGEIVLKEAASPSAEMMKARGVRLKIGQEGITGWVAATGQTLACNDVTQEPRYYKVELLPETQSELAVPLRAGERVIGVLDVQSNRQNAFEQGDVTALEILGNQVGMAIKNARLFQETKQRYEAMVALHETSLDIIARLETPALLEALLRRGAMLLDAKAGQLYLYDRQRALIHTIASYNLGRNWAGVTLQLGEGVIGQVIQTGHPMIINDYFNWPGHAVVFEGGTETHIVGVPLKWENQIIGGIDILNDPDGRTFDDNDIWLLSQFADLASIAVKNAELHTQIKQFSQELEQKVAERTGQLSRAKDEIAVKAERLRSLWDKTIRLQEEERARIARDMHDGVIQLITAARFELKATRVVAGAGLPPLAQEKMDALREILDEMERELRRAIYDLQPPMLDAVGLAPALQKHAAAFQELSGITCRVQSTGALYRLPPAIEITVFRLVEESLHNVLSHAQASEASVTLDFAPGSLCVSVQDDGRGFDYEQGRKNGQGTGLGLLGMRERVKSLNGDMKVWSSPGQGTRLTFRLPVRAEVEHLYQREELRDG